MENVFGKGSSEIDQKRSLLSKNSKLLYHGDMVRNFFLNFD